MDKNANAPGQGGARLSTTDDYRITAAADKLLRLHWAGYVTRAELEEALGTDTPPGRWECPGEFGMDGKFRQHCGRCAA